MYALKERTITARGSSSIENAEGETVEVAIFEAVINSTNPLNVSFNYYAVDETLYKANITQCRADEASFAQYVRGVQDEMLSDLTTLL